MARPRRCVILTVKMIANSRPVAAVGENINYLTHRPGSGGIDIPDPDDPTKLLYERPKHGYERWEDYGLGRGKKEILQNLQEQRGHSVQAWSLMASLAGDVAALIPDHEQAAFMLEHERKTYELMRERRHLPPIDRSAIFHAKQNRQGEDQPHWHAIYAASFIKPETNIRKDFVNFEKGTSKHITIYHEVAEQALDEMMIEREGPEWKQQLPPPRGSVEAHQAMRAEIEQATPISISIPEPADIQPSISHWDQYEIAAVKLDFSDLPTTIPALRKKEPVQTTPPHEPVLQPSNDETIRSGLDFSDLPTTIHALRKKQQPEPQEPKHEAVEAVPVLGEDSNESDEISQTGIFNNAFSNTSVSIVSYGAENVLEPSSPKLSKPQARINEEAALTTAADDATWIKPSPFSEVEYAFREHEYFSKYYLQVLKRWMNPNGQPGQAGHMFYRFPLGSTPAERADTVASWYASVAVRGFENTMNDAEERWRKEIGDSSVTFLPGGPAHPFRTLGDKERTAQIHREHSVPVPEMPGHSSPITTKETAQEPKAETDLSYYNEEMEVLLTQHGIRRENLSVDPVTTPAQVAGEVEGEFWAIPYRYHLARGAIYGAVMLNLYTDSQSQETDLLSVLFSLGTLSTIQQRCDTLVRMLHEEGIVASTEWMKMLQPDLQMNMATYGIQAPQIDDISDILLDTADDDSLDNDFEESEGEVELDDDEWEIDYD